MAIDKLKSRFFTGAWLTDVKHYFTKINEIIDWINNIGTPSYKSYVGLVTQTGTNDPTIKILGNNTLGTITLSYDGVGYYYLTSNGLFIEDKTALFFGPNGGSNSAGVSAVAVWEDSSNISLQTGTYQNDPAVITPVNGLLTNNTLEIRVYN